MLLRIDIPNGCTSDRTGSDKLLAPGDLLCCHRMVVERHLACHCLRTLRNDYPDTGGIKHVSGNSGDDHIAKLLKNDSYIRYPAIVFAPQTKGVILKGLRDSPGTVRHCAAGWEAGVARQRVTYARGLLGLGN